MYEEYYFLINDVATLKMSRQNTEKINKRPTFFLSINGSQYSPIPWGSISQLLSRLKMSTVQSLVSKYEKLSAAWDKKDLSECGKLLAEFKVHDFPRLIFATRSQFSNFFLNLSATLRWSWPDAPLGQDFCRLRTPTVGRRSSSSLATS